MDENKEIVNDTQPGPEKSPKRVSRKLRFGTIATVMTVVVIAVILLLNVVMDTVETAFPLTVDLTGGTYTLSEDSVALAKGVEQDVEIIVFMNESYFASPNTGYDVANTVYTQFYQTLRQYQVESGGKVRYQFIDLDTNPTAAATYQEYGIASGSILFLSGERYQVVSVNDLMSYDGDYTTGYTYSSEVERVVASKVNLVSAKELKKVTLLTGHDEDAYAISGLETMLSSNGCLIEELDITGSLEPSEDTDVFAIVGPTEDYSVDEVAKLRDWLNNGGTYEKDLVVLADSVARLPNLYEMLDDEYGIKVLDQVVVETDGNNVYNQNPYYVYGDVSETDYTASLVGERAMMGTVRTLALSGNVSGKNLETGELITYGDTAMIQPLASRLGEEGAQTGEESLVEADSYPLIGAAYATMWVHDNDVEGGADYYTNVMVYGSTTIAYDTLFGLTSACNEDLFLNVFRGLTGLESVVSVSNKPLDQTTLDFGGSTVPNVLGIGVFTVGLPLVMVAIAITVFVVRRRL